MKILVAHNAYQQRGGEDAVSAAEIELLRSHGHQVETYDRHNNEIEDMSRISAAVSTIWSRRTIKEIGEICDAHRPDLIHVHNTFPLISPSIHWVASRKRIPVVQTLHNFRLLCPQAMLLREQVVCEDCVGKIPWRAVTRKCYRDSTLQTVAVSAMLVAHQSLGTYRNLVSAYIALSKFSRDKFVEGGLPAERIWVKPNFVVSGREPTWESRKGGIFVGRLSAEKGLDVLIDAARGAHAASTRTDLRTSIKVVGAGPLEAGVREVFGENLLGFQAPAQVRELLHASLFMVAPSTCYETFGLAAVEAFSCGVPVIASRHGGLGELVEDGVTGLLFSPGDAQELRAKILWAEANPDAMLRMGRAAYAEYLKKYTPEKNYKSLVDIYRRVLPAAKGEPHAA
ncbi:glycosyltransferase [soil metagenome]